ncbi:MAG: endonuclease/exonuclease/phosphatase family protein [Polyangiaceae bacterium]
MKSLRVVTLNLWNVTGDWEQRREVIRRDLRALDPDLIAFQEVVDPGQTGDFDQARDACEGLGVAAHSQFVSAPAAGWPIGNSILSRWPIRRHVSFELPNGGTSEVRAALFTEIDSPIGVIPFATTHLNWKLDEGHVRVEQVKALVEKLESLASADDYPLIIAGDFNAEPISDEIRYLRGHTGLGGKCTYFADSFATAGDGSPGYTFCRHNPNAATSFEPDRRLDYIFVRRREALLRGHALRSWVCFDKPREEVWASDHFGVAVDLGV